MTTETASWARSLIRRGLKVFASTVTVVVFLGTFFWLAGRTDWPAGWAYVGLLAAGHTASALIVWRKNPEVLRRRARIGRGTKTWDKVWLAVFGLFYSAELVITALDAGRFGWSSMSGWLWPLGASLYGFFLVVITWAMIVNPHFEKTVRIQHDRGHRVIDTGPYRIVRHPGYLGTIVGFILSPPLLLGSWWAFVPATLTAVWMVVRTVFEDRTLRKELAGYEPYARRVRYRLMPGVW